MKRMIDQSLNHFWKISYGQIYPALRQLTEAGWAAASPALSDKKQDRKEYMITAEGQNREKFRGFSIFFYHIFIPVKLSTTIVAIARSQRL
ncbi:PadR family transcriptional regulator [Bacillus licheniformis]|nr:PadR family transcriptional regulator [Bacillus licheniformis]